MTSLNVQKLGIPGASRPAPPPPWGIVYTTPKTTSQTVAHESACIGLYTTGISRQGRSISYIYVILSGPDD